MGPRAATFFKAAAIPLVVSVGTTAAMLISVLVPFQWRGSVYSAVWFGLMAVGSLGVLASAIGGWLFLRRRLQTRTALALLVPYLVVVGAELVATWLVTMAITGDGP